MNKTEREQEEFDREFVRALDLLAAHAGMSLPQFKANLTKKPARERANRAWGML